MALPHLRPISGVRDPAAYANLAAVRPLLKSAVARRAAAVSEAQQEERLKRKVDQANRVLDALEARDAKIAAQIKALQKLKSANAARLEKIEDEAIGLMQEAGLSTVAGIRSSFRIQPAAAALEVVDASKVPAEFFRQPKTPPKEVDKVAVKKALAENDDLDPAAWGVKLASKISLIRT